MINKELSEIVDLFMNENDRLALEKLYKITNDKLIKILSDWKNDYNEAIDETFTDANGMYNDMISYIWDKYNLSNINENKDKKIWELTDKFENKEIEYKDLVKKLNILNNYNQDEVKADLELITNHSFRKYEEINVNQILNEYIFIENLNKYKEGLKSAKEDAPSEKYITVEDIGNKYSKELANLMFDCEFAWRWFEDKGNLVAMKGLVKDVIVQDISETHIKKYNNSFTKKKKYLKKLIKLKYQIEI